MNPHLIHPRKVAILALAGLAFVASSASAQTPFADLPNLTAAQSAALTESQSTTVPLLAAALNARRSLRVAIYSAPNNGAEIRAKVAEIKAAELAFALARADVFADMQASAHALSADQVEVLIWQGVRPLGATRRMLGAFGGGGGGRGGAPAAAAPGGGNTGDGFAGLGRNNRGGGGVQNFTPVSDTQQTMIAQLNEQPAIVALSAQVSEAKRAAVRQVYAPRKDATAIETLVATWMEAEIRLAEAQNAEFAAFQASSPHRLTADQVQSFAAGTLSRTGL